MKKEHIFIIVLVVLVAGIALLTVINNKRSKIDRTPELTTALTTVANHLKDTGVKFYGASWCPHCASQKAFFKSAVKDLPYIECSTGGAGTPQTQICIDAKIEGYPTWEFKQDVRASMEITPSDLASVTNTTLDEVSKTELSKQKEIYLSELNEKQKQSYLEAIKKLENQMLSSKK